MVVIEKSNWKNGLSPINLTGPELIQAFAGGAASVARRPHLGAIVALAAEGT